MRQHGVPQVRLEPTLGVRNRPIFDSPRHEQWLAQATNRRTPVRKANARNEGHRSGPACNDAPLEGWIRRCRALILV